MTKKRMLEECIDDYKKTPVRIILEWDDGTKAGIDNKEAIDVAMTALRGELQRQSDEL